MRKRIGRPPELVEIDSKFIVKKSEMSIIREIDKDQNPTPAFILLLSARLESLRHRRARRMPDG